jgi:hypothetical protein
MLSCETRRATIPCGPKHAIPLIGILYNGLPNGFDRWRRRRAVGLLLLGRGGPGGHLGPGPSGDPAEEEEPGPREASVDNLTQQANAGRSSVFLI